MASDALSSKAACSLALLSARRRSANSISSRVLERNDSEHVAETDHQKRNRCAALARYDILANQKSADKKEALIAPSHRHGESAEPSDGPRVRGVGWYLRHFCAYRLRAGGHGLLVAKGNRNSLSNTGRFRPDFTGSFCRRRVDIGKFQRKSGAFPRALALHFE